MKKAKRILFLVLALALVVSLVGCGKSNEPAKQPAADAGQKTTDNAPKTSGNNESSTNAPDANAKASTKDTVTIRIAAEPMALLPAAMNDKNAELITEQVLEPLFYTQVDGTIVPCLATEWKYGDAENTELVITLRDNVYFHNGEKMTADDVVFSYNTSIASKSTANVNTALDHMEKVDEKTVMLKLKFPFGAVEYCIANRLLVIFPQKAYEADPDGFARAPIGTGPYSFVSWAAGDKIEITRNDNWWGEKPALKDVTYKIIGDASSAAIALESGNIDVLMSPGSEDLPHLQDSKNLAVYTADQVGVWQVGFLADKGIFQDINLRKAVAHAINKEEFVYGVLNGYGSVAESVISKSAFGYDPDHKFLEYDLDKAKEYMAAAGYPDGFDFEFSVQEYGNYVKVAEVLQGQLAKIGINLTPFNILERGAYTERSTKNREFDMSITSFSASYPDADYIWNYYNSAAIEKGRNSSHIMDERIDSLLNEGRSSSDQERRKEIYAEIADIWNEEVFSIPLFSEVAAQATNSKLAGFKPTSENRIRVADWFWVE